MKMVKQMGGIALAAFPVMAIAAGAELSSIVAIETGSPLPIVAAGMSPALVVSNSLVRPVSWTVSADGDDMRGHSFRVPEEICRLEAGESRRILLPPSLAKGVWRLAVDVREEKNPVCRAKRRFAVLDPHPVTPVVEDGSFRIGVHVHCARYPQQLSDRVVEAVARTGAKLVRTDYAFMFSDVYPDGPEIPHWEKADRLLGNFRDHGLALDAIIYGNPEWAMIPELKALKGRGKWSVATKPGLFGKFAGEIASRYGTCIAYYEIGNELDAFPANKLPPREMLRIQREAYEAIKKVAPQATVIPCGWAMGGVLINPAEVPKWGNPELAELFLKEGRRWFDAWPIHGHGAWDIYQYWFEEKFQPALKDLGAGGLPWLANETARSSFMGQENDAAVDVWRKILYSRAYGARDYIWYNLRATRPDPNSAEGGYGLMTMDLEPRAGYSALSAVTTIFHGLDFDERIVSEGPRQLYRFKGAKDGFAGIVLAGWYMDFSDGTRVRVRTDAKRALAADIMNNRCMMPVAGGEAVFRWGDIPSALLLEGATFAECVAADLDAKVPPPAPRIIGGDGSQGRTWDIELSDQGGWPVNLHEGMPHLEYRLWQGWEDAFSRLWFDRVGADKIRFHAEGQDDKRGAEDGIELTFEREGAGRKTHLAKPIRRSGKADFYDVTLGYTETGLDAAALTNGFGLCVRLLDDDGEGLDCWLQLKRGVPPPFIRVKFQ